MIDPIPKSVKKAWNDWNVRGVVLGSLFLQTFLILFAPFRKGTSNKLMMVFIWSAYLLADSAANYAVGLISDNKDNKPDASAPQNSDLIAMWPTFLLVHLGGQDTITAFSLEDNELWIRHMLAFISQAVAAVYIFLLSLPENKAAIPTILMFAAGVIKYFERTRALYLASLDSFRDSMLQEPDPGPNYAKLMEELASKKEAKLPTRIIALPEPERKPKAVKEKLKLTDLDVVHYAFKYFNIFKGLIVDLIYSFRERDESRAFFNMLEEEDAFRIIEVELNFIYEVFYTKVEVLHSWVGYLFRFIACGSAVAALSIFHFKVNRHGFDDFDVAITYALFWGAIVLDILSLLMFLRSDWTLAVLSDDEDNRSPLKNTKRIAAWCLKWVLLFRRPWWQECSDHSGHSHWMQATPFFLRRWSGSVSGQNLIRYCLRIRPTQVHRVKSLPRLAAEKIIQFLLLDKVFQFFKLAAEKVKSLLQLAGDTIAHFLQLVTEEVKRYLHIISESLKNLIRSWDIDIVFEKIYDAFKRVNKFLCIGKLLHGLVFILKLIFIRGPVYLIEMAFDMSGLKSLFDEILYISHEPFTKELWKFLFEEIKRKAEYADDGESAKRIYSAKGEWILLDLDPKGERFDKLMGYVADVAYDESLLTWHIATELLYHTDKDNNHVNDDREFSKLLSDYMLYLLVMQPTLMSAVAGIGKIRFRDTRAEVNRFFERKSPINEKQACEKILEVNTYVKPVAVKGDRSKSVLFDASMLAKELNRLANNEKVNKWELVSKVWVELLSYAASHATARTHAEQVSKGGELISFVWLLMAHFGLGEQFQINKGQGRSKLLVGK